MKSFAKLAELPNKDGKLTLKLVRDDFDRGQSAVDQLQKELDRQIGELSPPASSVDQLFTDSDEDETRRLTGSDPI